MRSRGTVRAGGGGGGGGGTSAPLRPDPDRGPSPRPPRRLRRGGGRRGAVLRALSSAALLAWACVRVRVALRAAGTVREDVGRGGGRGGAARLAPDAPPTGRAGPPRGEGTPREEGEDRDPPPPPPPRTFLGVSTLREARSLTVAPLPTDRRPVDAVRYTIRMNTWRRNEHLLLSVDHHAKCDGVLLIQVVWCDAANDPPESVVRHPSGKVVVERHGTNSLNERFRIPADGDGEGVPTLGVLSLDDDVLRPCEALDAAFVRWTRHPDRIVGFDARSHRIDRRAGIEAADADGEDARPWAYGMVGGSNEYSMTLPSKAAFVHRDYLDAYASAALPRPISDRVDADFECEDVALSLLVSSLTDGRPPLLADAWTVPAVELYARGGISRGEDHHGTRSRCVNDFAEALGLKAGRFANESGVKAVVPLRFGTLDRGSLFGYGDEPEAWDSVDPRSLGAPRLRELAEKLRRRERATGGEEVQRNWDWAAGLRRQVEEAPRAAGLVQGTPEWKLRWLYNCAVELNADERTAGCFGAGAVAAARAGAFFVCEVTEGVLHHSSSGTGEWMIAGPPKGFGVHEYAAFAGDAAPCENIGRCRGCLDPPGARKVCAARIDPENCALTLTTDGVTGDGA